MMFQYFSSYFSLASAKQWQCDDGNILSPMQVDLLILQDASASFSSQKDLLSTQVFELAQDIEATFAASRLGLTSFIDDAIPDTAWPDIYCYSQDLPMDGSISPLQLRNGILAMENISNYDYAEGILKAMAISFLTDQEWNTPGKDDLPVLRMMIAATDNQSKHPQEQESFDMGTKEFPTCDFVQTDGTCGSTEHNTWDTFDPTDVCGDNIHWRSRRLQQPNVSQVIDTMDNRDIRVSLYLSAAIEDHKTWWKNAKKAFDQRGQSFNIIADNNLSTYASDVMIAIMNEACTAPPTTTLAPDASDPSVPDTPSTQAPDASDPSVPDTPSTQAPDASDPPVEDPPTAAPPVEEPPTAAPPVEEPEEQEDDNTAVIIGTTVAASAAVIGGVVAGGYFYMGGSFSTSVTTTPEVGHGLDIPAEEVIEREQYINPYETIKTMYR